MRSALLILLASLSFATTPARAQSRWLERDMVTVVCSREAAPAAGERLASRLNLTDAQKSALNDMTGACASANASAKKSLCSDKPDLSRRFMKHWTRGRRERSTLAVAWAAYSTGGARDKGLRYCDRGCSSKDQDGGKRRLGNDYSNHHLPMGQLDLPFEKSRVPSVINFCQLVMN